MHRTGGAGAGRAARDARATWARPVRVTLACLLALVVALWGAATVRAAGEGSELHIHVAPATDEAYAADVATAGVVVDAYRFAEPDGTLVAPFEGLASALEAAQAGTGDWQALATDAAALVAGAADAPRVSPEEGLPADGAGVATITLDDGLYLLVARDAHSQTHGYEFQAALVQLPEQTEVTLKSSRTPLVGSLVINKQVNGFSGEASTFVFRIAGESYEEYAAITYPNQTSVTVTHIPAGLTVTVTEVYTGARYGHVSGNGSTATIASDLAVSAGEASVATVSFVNEPTGEHTPGGHGIQNNFELDETGDWPLTATPGGEA